jgi:hypothetical protein
MEVLRIPSVEFWSVKAPPCQELQNIAKELYDKYPCFRDTWTAHERRGGPKPDRNQHKPSEKPRIGKRELSCEAIAEKDFLGILNKIAPSNKDKILSNLQKQVRPEFDQMYLTTLWEHFLRSDTYQSVLIDVLHELGNRFDARSFVQMKWRQYVQTRAWVPPLPPDRDGHNYDEFCDAVKWRKRAMAILQMWRGLVDSGWIPHGEMTPLQSALAKDIDAELAAEKPVFKACEIMLEEFCLVIKLFGASEGIREWIIPMKKNAAQLPPAVRFKVYDIFDII